MEDKQSLGDEVFVKVIKGDKSKTNLKEIKNKLEEVTEMLAKLKGSK